MKTKSARPRRSKTSGKRAARPRHDDDNDDNDMSEPCARIVALTLADETARELDSDQLERNELVGAALAIGQWAADQGHPGRWDRLDPAAVLKAMAFTSEHEASGFLLTMTTLIGYAGLAGHLPAPAARRIVLAIKSLTAHPVVTGFATSVAEQLRAGPLGPGWSTSRDESAPH